MESKIAFNSRVYTDIQGLDNLKAHSDSPEAKKEVAQQFEAILMQMVLGSMRDANKAFVTEGFGTQQMDMYQDLFDKQLSLVMSKSGVGFAAMIEKNMDQQAAAAKGVQTDKNVLMQSAHVGQHHPLPSVANMESAMPAPVEVATEDKSSNAVPAVTETEPKKTFASPEDFVKKLWSAAKSAAKVIGASPEFLLAQAALETNWGKNIISHDKESSSYNLFNIKAGNNWEHKTVAADTLEQKNGVLVKERASFRSYNSFGESFQDYVSMLTRNDRYSDTLKKVTDPAQFASALQNAGYATDQNYADKVMKIFSSRNFQGIVKKMQSMG
jgi:peptidoglycan hydrolase FlgJ